VNHLILLKDLEDAEENDWEVSMEHVCSRASLSRRAFTVQCIYNMEALVLTFGDLDLIKKDFRFQMIKFVKQNVQ
jgi:hypothetical protein